MSSTNKFVFVFLTVIAWLIFVGLSIEAGGLLVNFFFSIYNPEFVKNLYQKLDLSAMYRQSPAAFFSVYSFILAIALLKAYLFYIVITLLRKLDLKRPFNSFVSAQVMRISYFTFSVGILSLIGRQTSHRLLQRGYDVEPLYPFWSDGQAFILMAAVVYIIATIIKRGIELQSENDLTV